MIPRLVSKTLLYNSNKVHQCVVDWNDVVWIRRTHELSCVARLSSIICLLKMLKDSGLIRHIG
jgi:hypothetical protein